MSEMIERVAKAAYSSLFLDGDEWPEISCSVSAEQFRDAARVAIHAMREPTEAMALATGSDWGAQVEDNWRKMVDAAGI